MPKKAKAKNLEKHNVKDADDMIIDHDKKEASVLKKLYQYKDIIGLICFFLGGLFWVFGYFATKAELKDKEATLVEKISQLECITKSNLQMIKGKMEEQFFTDLLHANHRELCEQQLALERTNMTSDEAVSIKVSIAKFEDQRKQLLQDKQKARDSAQAGMDRLSSGCRQKD